MGAITILPPRRAARTISTNACVAAPDLPTGSLLSASGGARLVFGERQGHGTPMDLDALLDHFFGTDDLDSLDDVTIEAGRQRIEIAFGTERDAGRRFALWILLHALGAAPDPVTGFKDPKERKAAEDYAWAARRMERD